MQMSKARGKGEGGNRFYTSYFMKRGARQCDVTFIHLYIKQCEGIYSIVINKLIVKIYISFDDNKSIK
jgi:hypothetical protein